MVNPGSSVFLFIGKDSYLKEKAVKDLTSSILKKSSKDLDSKVFYGGEAEAGEIIDQINTIPFFASKRLVVIKDLEKATSELRSRLAGYIKKPSKSTCLVLESADDSLLKEHADIAGHLKVKRFGEMTGHEIALWIKESFASKKKKVDADAVSVLKEMHGQNLSLLAQEIEKLIAFTGDKAEVGLSDVEELVGKSVVASTFDLADALGAKRAQEALRICHELVASGKKEYEIIGLLCWHFKRILKAKTLQSRGESEYRIASAVKISQKYCSDFFAQVAGFDMASIRSRIQMLLEADLDIKRTRFNQTLVLEVAIIRLCLG